MGIEYQNCGDQKRDNDGRGAIVAALSASAAPAGSVADGAISGILSPGLYEIVATSDCRVNVTTDNTATNGDDGITWHTGKVGVRLITGYATRIGVSAL